ncbi:hypothetical protein MHBO_001002 [Bonamia ostreae]|uniref:Uncharacterized protein n=1 Tax=Bonamia ostreae TaxID=126728 RepID=A0ABV2AHJ5_9EUKA
MVFLGINEQTYLSRYIEDTYNTIPWKYFAYIEDDYPIPSVLDMIIEYDDMMESRADCLWEEINDTEFRKALHKEILIEETISWVEKGNIPLNALFMEQRSILKKTRKVKSFIQNYYMLSANDLKPDSEGFIELGHLQGFFLSAYSYKHFWYIISTSEHFEIKNQKVRSRNKWNILCFEMQNCQAEKAKIIDDETDSDSDKEESIVQRRFRKRKNDGELKQGKFDNIFNLEFRSIAEILGGSE